MHSGLTSTPHVTDWQDTQLSWRESGHSNGARVHCICDPVALLCVPFIVCSQFCQVVFCCLIAVRVYIRVSLSRGGVMVVLLGV